jgi:uncharacterized protein YgbK (DUF1537 family)
LPQILADLEGCFQLKLTPVLFTTRKEMYTTDKNRRLTAGRKISGFLTSVVKSLSSVPGYIVAKGGITSHDILVRGLEISMARVAGQVIPGVPVIITGDDHFYPAMPFIIFPGNVGDDQSLSVGKTGQRWSSACLISHTGEN